MSRLFLFTEKTIYNTNNIVTQCNTHKHNDLQKSSLILLDVLMPIDTNGKNFPYTCTMENSNNTPKDPQPKLDLGYWENEISYFENAMEGLHRSYAILASLKQQAQVEYDKLVPEREEVE